jgi:hypothetical protein
MKCECGKECGAYKKCYTCNSKNKNKCRCGKLKETKYSLCYKCQNCHLCNATGMMYISDDVWGTCECQPEPFKKMIENYI